MLSDSLIGVNTENCSLLMAVCFDLVHC